MTDAPVKLPLIYRLSRITWPWFTCTMSTGAIAALLSQQPFPFRGLVAIGTMFFIFDAVLFFIFNLMMFIRITRNPRAWLASLHHPNESFFFGAYWVSVALIIYSIQAYGVPRSGPWLIRALEVLFWVYISCSLCVAIFQYQAIFSVERLLIADAMPAWILPAYPSLVTGPLAGVLLKSQPVESGQRILIAGIAIQGLGWTIAFIIYTMYLTRLTTHKMPAHGMRPGMYVAVGPAAYTSAGLISLGRASPGLFPTLNLSSASPTPIPVGSVMAVLGFVSGIFLFLVAFWFCALATITVLRVVRRMSWTLNWWAFIFPNVGLAIACIQIGDALGSKGVQGVGAGLTLLLIVMWIFVMGASLRALWKGQVLSPNNDPGLDDVELVLGDAITTGRNRIY
ncbi:hypothetical protein P152DRAFT_325632 [Eremomyces bilateralis CBS 781.70]|uniref:C4-dicarboxylate transporter/malic acid transport protein n=1 Tax=Eremomyces bilateralis CBS 781.70 TaxID=1392243 RepID=A0A6G1G3Y4_9PEZI|nr:uncharacterized protein P152DRAFT_325632 [Eremomyces bilateralis CBS 781.70]KAF1812773.1 hypothetical protein P152DRAFT_325632 [Eremomyces bilateralis CBS 781.70]